MYTSKLFSFSYCITAFIIVFGLFLYDYIDKNLGFSYIDELICSFLFLYTFSNHKISGELKICFLIFFVYTIYSLFYTKINCPQSVFMDLIIFIKPFVCFFTTLSLDIRFSEKQKLSFKILCLGFACFLLIVGLGGKNLQFQFFGHPSRFATNCTIISIVYFYFSDKQRKDVYISIALASIGLLSLRSKCFGFFVFFSIIMINKNEKELSFNFLSLFIIAAISSIAIYFSWEKIDFYFISGSSNDIQHAFARPLMYQYFYKILFDFFPFGCGLGTYASNGSTIYYSPIYHLYGLDCNYSIGNGHYLTDAFYPSLAMFGVVGVFLYIFFWCFLYKLILKEFHNTCDFSIYKIGLLIIVFFAIEGVADSTFVQNRGIVTMFFLALLIKGRSFAEVSHYNWFINR